MGTIARAAHHQQSWMLSAKVRQYTLALLLSLAFVLAFTVTLHETARRPTLGLGLTQDSRTGAWVVDGIAYSSDAARAGAMVGDVVQLIDGKALLPGDDFAPVTAGRATQIVLQRPATGRVITIGVLGQSPRSLSLLPYLFIGIIFFV